MIRPLVALLALVTLTAAAAPATTQRPPHPVRNGIDVLRADGFAALRGRRVGVITNHTGRALDGTNLVDLLLGADGVEVGVIFSPEHGFAGKLDQSEIADATHGSGLKIRSLYGQTRKPTAEMVEGLDTLVFDIQDIGCRFYTYVATMRLAMEAAAEHGLRFVVLDRPNPIGGHRVAGPVLAAGDESFIATHTIPVQHGMTVGELAAMMNAERGIGCDLQVVRCEGWRREMRFDALGQLWVNPSPNMRNLNQALLYPGIGLVEFTNVSVGRGTDTPFEIVGAPWLDGRALAAALNAADLRGLTFVPVEFTPAASRFQGERCEGVQILITDREAVDALAAGMTLACALRDVPPRAGTEGAWNDERYARLLSEPAVFEALRAGQHPAELIALWQDELAAFRSRRAGFLLY